MPQTTSTLTVTIGQIDFFVKVGFSYNPGEPMVRYYADGSGYPGSDPEVDCILWVDCIECEYPTPRSSCGWGYQERADRPGAFDIADRWIFAELTSGAYDDELFANVECEDYA